MPEEVSVKEFQKLKDQFNKFNQKFNDLLKKSEQKTSDNISNLEKKLVTQVDNFKKESTERISKLEQKLKDEYTLLNQNIEDQGKIFEKKIEDLENLFKKEFNEKFGTLEQRIDGNHKLLNSEIEKKIKTIDQQLNVYVNGLKNDIKSINNLIKKNKGENSVNLKTMKNDINAKEDGLKDLIITTDKKITEFRNEIIPVIENLKSQQDLVKIAVDVLKNQIYESAKDWINDEIKLACKNKEKEILMNLWIEEMKEIINDVDKLKEMHPKELKLHLSEISSTIESYKKKFIK
ncbi:MAG: hypothetical protein ACFFCE_18900 [Promethearchaeota archaeon]